MEEMSIKQLERIPLPQGLEERLSQRIDEWAAKERRSLLHRRLAIAAAACVAIVLGLAIWNPATEPQGTGKLVAKANQKEPYAKARGNKNELIVKEHGHIQNIIKEKNTVEENPIRDDLFVAQGFNPGTKKETHISSPSGETYLTAEAKAKETSPKGEGITVINENPGLKPCATKRTSLWDFADDETPQNSSARKSSSPEYSSPITSRPEVLFASLSPEERLMRECDKILLEEEYQYSEQQMRLVEL